MKDGQWTTSMDGESFDGQLFDTKEAAIEDMKKTLQEDDLKNGFWVGQISSISALQCVDAEDVIDCAFDKANQEYGEGAEDWLEDVNEKAKQELNDLLQKWFFDNDLDPHFFTIKNSEKILLQ